MMVALRKESVDRNYNSSHEFILYGWSLSARRAWIEIVLARGFFLCLIGVALRKESVDRNCQLLPQPFLSYVALRKESVDRNIARGQLPTPKPPSLSARRAWIEIGLSFARKIRFVASLSARRAWIEIGRTF